MLRLCKFRKFILSKKIPRSLTILRSAVTTSSPVIEDSDLHKEGDQIHGYTVKQVSEIPEFHATGILLEHDVTGAEHLHLERDDQNNVFSVAFRTTPMDSTGVSHILEHTVLCGSEKFPCRDPFFKMLNRSLSTFMNAFTASDWTMYPFSTQNEKDFANLMSVYLDSVFFPLLNELDFCQEGWRLEQSDLKNPSSDIIFKGVVFNEMKGALSNAESLYANHHQCLLMPHHTYGYNSGGDPLCIPQLTYEQLKEFHRSHYHPSNAKFYTYGNFPLENHLKTINASIMKKFQKINPGTEIPIEPKWKEPKWVEIDCPPDTLAPDPDKQTIVSVSYLLDYIEDPFEAFTIGILSALLVDGPNSPFYQALIEPNIGSDYSPVVGVDSHTKNPSFAVGLQGIHPDDVDKVVNIIKETFQNVVKNGFDPMRIESILHRIELALKHQTSNFGLNMIIAVIYSWNQGKNPLDSFSLNKQVKRFRDTMEQDPEFLQKKVKELFLSNTHELTLVMKPKETYTEEKDRKENELLQEKISLLSDEDKRNIYEKALKLEELQNEKEDASFLPKMQISDIEENIKTYDVEKDYLDDVEVYQMKQPTNGITYFSAIATTSSIPYTLRPYLPLFSNVITKLGAGSMSYKELAQQIELNTGSLGVSTHIAAHHTEEDCFEQGILLSSHALERNIPMMFSLWQDVLNSPTLYNPERLQTLINASANDLAMSVAHSGHLYAMTCAAKNLTPAAQISELFGGMSQVNFMKEIAEKDILDHVIENLMKLVTYMLNVNEMRCSLNTAEELMEQSVRGLDGLISSLNKVGYDDKDMAEENNFHPRGQQTFIEMEFPVNYVSRCIRTVPYTHEDNSKLQILAKLLSAKYLHREIREKGGAYGSGAKIGGSVFSFFSYRDPNTLKTLDTFDSSVKWACNGSFTESDIEEAKLSVFSAVDSPVAPANRGMILFQNGLTNEMRQRHRDRLFAAGKEDLIDVANRYLIVGKQVHSEAIIGPQNDALLKDDNWIKPRKLQL